MVCCGPLLFLGGIGMPELAFTGMRANISCLWLYHRYGLLDSCTYMVLDLIYVKSCGGTASKVS